MYEGMSMTWGIEELVNILASTKHKTKKNDEFDYIKIKEFSLIKGHLEQS